MSKEKASRIRRKRERLFKVDPYCHYCRVRLVLEMRATSKAYNGQEKILWSATLDHIVPVSQGGTIHNSNILLSCSWCNSYKGIMTYDEYMGSGALVVRKLFLENRKSEIYGRYGTTEVTDEILQLALINVKLAKSKRTYIDIPHKKDFTFDVKWKVDSE